MHIENDSDETKCARVILASKLSTEIINTKGLFFFDESKMKIEMGKKKLWCRDTPKRNIKHKFNLPGYCVVSMIN